jgi:hypothetical protein
MRDAGWAVVLIYSLAGFLFICGLSAIVTGVWKKHQKTQRRNKRLYGHGNIYSTRDMK